MGYPFLIFAYVLFWGPNHAFWPVCFRRGLEAVRVGMDTSNVEEDDGEEYAQSQMSSSSSQLPCQPSLKLAEQKTCATDSVAPKPWTLKPPCRMT